MTDKNEPTKAEPHLFPLVSLHDGDYQKNLYPDGKWRPGPDNWKQRLMAWLYGKKQGDKK